jgi:SAM-dependent methyltransferase
MAKEHYVIRGGSEGRERLRVIARVMQPFTDALFDRVGIGPGSQVLDVGCGGGDVTFALARRIGPGGSMVGVDMDETKLALARQEAQREGLAHVAFRRADVTSIIAQSIYDVVYSRFLLSHLPDPSAALAKLFSALRPGGVLIIEDVDHSGCFCEPYSAAYRHYARLYRLLAKRRGVDADIGPRLPRLLIEAGFRDVGIYIVQPAALEGETKIAVPITLENIAPAILAENLMPAQELEASIKELHALARDNTTLMGLPTHCPELGKTALAD